MENIRPKKILVTGLPGAGKTTLIRKIAEAVRHLKPAGFYTMEIREQGVRKGFEINGFNGERGILSHLNIKSPHRVGRYGVDVESFEKFVRDTPFFHPEAGIIIIDEIGKMECLSKKFRELIGRILESDRPFIATVALKGEGWIRRVKERNDVLLFTIRPDNRDHLLEEILAAIRSED